LTQDGPRLACARGHAFDRAREGYWNLLQPQDRRSPSAGDRDEATDARRSWLARGFADGLVDAVREGTATEARTTVVDVGCGEGTLTAKLFGGDARAVCGVDLSAHAVSLASRRQARFTWIVANADRGLPFLDGSIDLAMSIFGRRPAAELSRVLAPGGLLVAVVPGPDDLIELRAAAMGEGRAEDRVGATLRALGPELVLRRHTRWRHRAHHDRAAIADALAMSYRGVRRHQQERLLDLDGLDVTLSAEILVLTASPRPPRPA
jgi:23S rRNA (guanine745-N1)-methyltransferase